MPEEKRIIDGVLYGFGAEVGAWVNERVGGGLIGVPFYALGVLPEKQDEAAILAGRKALTLVAGAYFFNYFGGDGEDLSDIYMACACDNLTALRPAVLRKLLAYPFGYLKVRRISAEVAADNERALKQAEAFGFEIEGIKRKMGRNGSDVVQLGLLPEDCPFWDAGRKAAA